VAQRMLLSKLARNTAAKSGKTFSATCLIFIKLPKVNNHPIGEKSPNLVTLIGHLPASTKRVVHRHYWHAIHTLKAHLHETRFLCRAVSYDSIRHC
jgi:hypothetical protein